MSKAYRVVILDDEPWSREVVKSLGKWEELNLEVVGEADDGDAGLELVARTDADIVITDMRMPGMDGTDLLRELSNRHPALRIVVMSGYDDFAYLRQALQSRAEDYLLKPIDPQELNRTLETCISRMETPDDRRPVSMRTPVVFEDPAVLDEYVEHRRRSFSYLLELDAAGVRGTLEDMRRLLTERVGANHDRDVLERIAHDHVLMLEEFMVRNGVPVDPDLFRPRDLYAPNAGDQFETLARLFERAIEHIETFRRNGDQLDLKDVKDHIDHYFRDPLSLHSVAKLFLVSKEHLSRAFRKSFGATVNDYITERRMTAAHELLAEGSFEIKEIARMVGYNDLAYFYRVFKKQFGFPPGQMR